MEKDAPKKDLDDMITELDKNRKFIPVETKVVKGTFGYDLLHEGVFGRIYDLPGTGSMFRPVGVSVRSERGSYVENTVLEIVAQTISQGVEGPGYGAEINHYCIPYLLDKPRNLDAEKRLHPISIERTLA